MRIIKSAAKRLKLPLEKVHVNLDKLGNMSAASIPVALDEAVRSGKSMKMISCSGWLRWRLNVGRLRY